MLSRPTLERQHFDAVIIGGGINGAAIARELTRVGKSILLVEQHDFGSGTTSRSTRIIHGGLRYLEYGELSLVRESLRERERLLAQAPHLVRPLHFLLALPPNSRRNALTVRFGLWLYRRIASRDHLSDAKEQRRRLEQLLDRGGRWSVFNYEDAQCEYPERLIIEWLVEAANSGAVVRNYTEALTVIRCDGVVAGVRLRDLLDLAEYEVECNWVINATGPWADFLCRSSNIDTGEPLIGGVRGSHILLPLFPGAPDAAVYTEAVDGRPIFIIPWAGQLMVGTTEVRDTSNPSDVSACPDEVAYLLKSFQRLFPSVRYTFSDIRAAYAGIRPLPHVTEHAPNSVTRRHFLIDHADDGAENMISVIGGKLTTACALARECTRALGINIPEPQGYDLAVASAPGDRLDSLFGPTAPDVQRTIQFDSSFAQPICEHTDHLVGEAVYSAQQEFAVTLADILFRRVPVAFSPCWSDECTRTAAQRIGRALAWPSRRIATEIECFEAERAQWKFNTPVDCSGV